MSNLTPDDPDTRTEPPDEGLSLDTVYHILQNERRRMTLQHLFTTGRTDIGAIADDVAVRENDTTLEELPPSQRKRVYIALYQSHLPTLDEHDIVDYDRETNVVTPNERLSRFESYLPIASEARSTQSDVDHTQAFVLGATLVTAVALLGLAFLAGPELPSITLSLVVTGLVGVTGTYATSGTQ